MAIRSLHPGDPIPTTPPSRYPSSHGYVRLRWKIGIREYVETYEHRVRDGFVTTAPQVHHRNEVKDDNRPENLIPTEVGPHSRHHNATIPIDRARALYEEGIGTTTIGMMLDCNPAAVYRALRRSGVQMRDRHRPAANRVDVDDEQIRTWHSEGVRVADMARRLGRSRTLIQRRCDEMGLAPFPPGPPR